MTEPQPSRRRFLRECAAALAAAALLAAPTRAAAQSVSNRGFVEARGFGFAESAPNDPERAVGDVLLRDELFLSPSRWFQAGAGVDVRANSHDQVEDEWRLDVDDRGIQRPRVAVRRLSATLTAGGLSVTAGKQFIRWARADILNPEDRFAPRDYLNVVDTDLLPVLAVRPSYQYGSETVEFVWTPRFTPSRLPLIAQRWTVLPPEANGLTISNGESVFPSRPQYGARWTHAGERFEVAASYFDGFNHLPNIDVRPIAPAAVEVTRSYPALRAFGIDLAIPTGWLTFKGEAASFHSADRVNDDYVLYVVEVERQIGEWLLDGGYVGEVMTTTRGGFRFAPDEGIARSIIGRASYTVDPRRTIAIEGAARQSGDGYYVKGEFSQQAGQHWRVTLAGVGLAGHDNDFLGQYHRNSHGSIALRFSF